VKRLVGAALLGFFAAGHVLAMELSVAAAGGPYLPTQQAFRDVYGTAASFGLEVRWLATRNLGFSAGVMTIEKQGTAVSLDGGPDAIGVKLRLTGIPLTACLHIPQGRFDIDLGAGLAYHDFEETWVDEGGPADSGKKWGVVTYASVAYALTSRLSVVGTLRYLDVPTGRPSRLTDKVNLGGFQALVGVSWRVLR